MVNATVDNKQISVLLVDNESYTPASGSVQKVNVTIGPRESLKVNKNGTFATIISTGTTGERDAFSTEMVIDDTVTLLENGDDNRHGIYISGFEVN